MKENSPHAADANRITVLIDAELEDIVPGFLHNRRRDVTTLKEALARNDLPTVRLLGHRMKGDGGGYGFKTISIIGDTIEQASNRKDLAVLKQQIAALDDFLSRVNVVYRK